MGEPLVQAMKDMDSVHPPAIGSMKQSQDIDLSIVLAQIGEKSALELNHDILHLLAGQRVAVFEAPAESACVGIPLCHYIFLPAPQ